MRLLIAAFLVIGIAFVAFLLFWPSPAPTTSKPASFEPSVPGWLMALLPDPPRALPRGSQPATLANGQTWSGRFFAEDGKLGTARFHLLTGAELRITANAPGEDPQVLCLVTPGVTPGCEHPGRDQKGSIVVRTKDATVLLSAPQGQVSFAINE